MECYNKDKIVEKLNTAKEAFKSFGRYELKGRAYIQDAIIGCYDITLHYNEKVIQKRCMKANIKYSASKPEKMVLMLAMNVSSTCDDERKKARIRTYVRVLKRFDELEYDVEKAKEELEEFGIDYFANPRSKEQSEEEEGENDENQLEFDFGNETSEENDAPDEDNEDDEDESDDDTDKTTEENHEGSSSNSAQPSLSTKIVNFLKNNKIKDKSYVIWVTGGEAFKSTDVTLLQKLDDFEFFKLQ